MDGIGRRETATGPIAVLFPGAPAAPTDQRAADLRRQPDALGFASTEGFRGPAEREQAIRGVAGFTGWIDAPGVPSVPCPSGMTPNAGAAYIETR